MGVVVCINGCSPFSLPALCFSTQLVLILCKILYSDVPHTFNLISGAKWLNVEIVVFCMCPVAPHQCPTPSCSSFLYFLFRLKRERRRQEEGFSSEITMSKGWVNTEQSLGAVLYNPLLPLLCRPPIAISESDHPAPDDHTLMAC